MMPWYCDIREHVHTTEQEAAWCLELSERYYDALFHLMTYVRAEEVEQAVNLALLESCSDDVDVDEP